MIVIATSSATPAANNKTNNSLPNLLALLSQPNPAQLMSSLTVNTVIDVDTTELRSPSKSPAKSLSIKQKLEHWKPASSGLVDLDGKMERAAKRRHKFVSGRTASLAQRNNSVAKKNSQVQEQKKNQVQEAESALQASLLSAEQKRAAANEKRSEAAALHIAHAKQIADSQRAMKELLLHEKRQSIERRLAMAEAKQKLKLQKAAYKAAVAAAKAKALADEHKNKIDGQKEATVAKMEAAEIRKADMAEAKLNKLSNADVHAKQVRRNKGSTDQRATKAQTQLATAKESLAFEVDMKTAPLSPKKPAVQVRLEQHAAEQILGGSCDIDIGNPRGAAIRRRLSLLDEKKMTLSNKNSRVSQVVKRKLDDELTESQALQSKLAARHAAAECRRATTMSALISKAASHVERATNISKNKRSEETLATEQAKAKVNLALLAASRRNSKAIQERAAKGTAFAVPWSPQRKTSVASLAAC